MVYCGKIIYFTDGNDDVDQKDTYYVMVAKDITEVAQRIQNGWHNNLASFTCEEIGYGDNAVYFLREETLDDIRQENGY